MMPPNNSVESSPFTLIFPHRDLLQDSSRSTIHPMHHRQTRSLPLLSMILANLLSSAMLAHFGPLTTFHHLSYSVGPAAANVVGTPYPPVHGHGSLVSPPDEYRPEAYHEHRPDINDGYKPSAYEEYDTNTYERYKSGGYNYYPNLNGGEDLVAAASNVETNRRAPKRHPLYYQASSRIVQKRRINPMKYKKNNIPKRRFPPTIPDYYNDYYNNEDDYSYEETTKRPRRKFTRKTTPVYDEEAYDDSTEAITKPPRRRTTTIKLSERIEPSKSCRERGYNTEKFTPEITTTMSAPVPTARQVVPASSTYHTVYSSTSTTTTTPASTSSTSNGTLYGPPDYHHYPAFSGYGPSHGHENVSITYGPPSGSGPWQSGSHHSGSGNWHVSYPLHDYQEQIQPQHTIHGHPQHFPEYYPHN